MIDFLYSIDLNVFNLVNQSLSNPAFDKFFPFITDVKHWYIAYIFLWFILLFKGGKIGKIAAIVIILLIVTSDQLSSNLFKKFFERMRPCHVVESVNLLINCSNSYSFPSSHAVNNFAVAVFFYKLYPKFKWILFTVAALMAISRVFVGVHYPFDVLVGAIIGSIIGYIFAYVVLFVNKKFSK